MDVTNTTLKVIIPSVEYQRPEEIKISKNKVEKVIMWQEQQKILLEKKEVDEEIQKQLMRNKAKRDLEDWYTVNDKRVEEARIANRNLSNAISHEPDKIQPGTKWNRITKKLISNPNTANIKRWHT